MSFNNLPNLPNLPNLTNFIFAVSRLKIHPAVHLNASKALTS